jgi:hypothetical protein
MSEAYLTNWSFGGDTPDTRNRFHETALREARVATERRALVPESPAQASFLTRLRLAFAGQTAATEACNCPA